MQLTNGFNNHTPFRFNKRGRNGMWTVAVDTTEQYGYFEHDMFGEGGGLWFEFVCSSGGDLCDFDGTAILPRKVRELIRAMGFTVGEDFE